jgi:AraC-like DNA-binding protein
MLLLKTIVLLGALQGLIVTFLLAAAGRRQAERRQSKLLLAWLIFLISLACLGLYLSEQPWYNSTFVGGMIDALAPLFIIMPIGPLIYFYIRSCVEPDFRMGRQYRRHFYSVAVDLFQRAAALLFIIGLLTRIIPANPPIHFGVFLDYCSQYADIPRWISLTVYLLASTNYLKRTSYDGSTWPRDFLRVFWAFDILWLAFLIPYELPHIGDKLIDWLDWYPLYLPLVVMIYWLGIKGYLISFRPATRPAPEKKQGVSSTIPEEKLEQIILVLKKIMEEEKLWMNPELNLGKLASHCRVAPKQLSTVLNQHMDTTFSEFVNGYRVNAVRQRLRLPESRDLTIAGVAYECGFNSLATFQRAFKLTTGQSPKEFMINCDQIRI